MNITYHTDPGHGWFAVPITLLQRLAIHPKVSTYSYIDTAAGFVYLEEDCDASLFMAACDDNEIAVELVDKHTDRDHWIRNLPAFQSNHHLNWS